MTPHSIGTLGGPVEILTIFDSDGERAHAQSPGGSARRSPSL